jgi:aspartate racemase
LLRTILSLDISLAHVLHKLKVVLIGGEPLTYALVDLFYRKLPHAKLINFYGLTEGDGAYYPVLPHKKISFAPPIGRPIANTNIYILDPGMEPVPVGMSGEIYIANEGMARGYFKRPELNAQRFLPNPFCSSSETRLYKTGDRGRFLPDGNIEYLGRIDRMVKIRSFRVELGEVEAAINAHPDVCESVVVARPYHAESEEALTRALRLVAYVVLKKTQSISAQSLKSYLRAHLPDYALPGNIVLLECLPLLPAGKIDISALPDPDQVTRQLDENYVHPRDPLEIQLTCMWERILRISPIGIYDNFFDIGGDSLNAVDLFLQIAKDLQKDLPISVLMQAPTIAELAILIRQDPSSYSGHWYPFNHSEQNFLHPCKWRGDRIQVFCKILWFKPTNIRFAGKSSGHKDAPHTDVRHIFQILSGVGSPILGPYQCVFLHGRRGRF